MDDHPGRTLLLASDRLSSLLGIAVEHAKTVADGQVELDGRPVKLMMSIYFAIYPKQCCVCVAGAPLVACGRAPSVVLSSLERGMELSLTELRKRDWPLADRLESIEALRLGEVLVAHRIFYGKRNAGRRYDFLAKKYRHHPPRGRVGLMRLVDELEQAERSRS